MSVFFARSTQNSLPSESASTVHDSAPICPIFTPAGTQRQDALDLGIAVIVTGIEVEVQTVLDRLHLGDRHEADPHRRPAPMTTSRSRSDRILQPRTCTQNCANAGRSCASMTM